MRFWPASLQSRLMALLFLALLLANTLTLSLLFYERMSSARSVMLGNLASDVATSVAILTACRPLSAHNGCRSWRAAIIAICWTPGSAAITRTTGAPGTQRAPAGGAERAVSGKYCGDPRPAAAYSGPYYPSRRRAVDPRPVAETTGHRPLAAGGADRSVCPPAGLRLVRGSPVLLPISRFTHAVNAPEPASDTAGTMAEQGPEEVRRAARAFNAMQARIHDHLQERARILPPSPTICKPR